VSLPRPEVVSLMVEEALDAMQRQAVNTTPDEVFSACFTIALQATRAAVKMGGDLSGIREVIGQIYAVLPTEPVN
jgi:hypothetical protein